MIDKEDHSDRSQRAEALARRSGCQHRAPAGERESTSKGAAAEAARASARIEKRIPRQARAFVTVCRKCRLRTEFARQEGVAGMLTIYGGHLDRFRMVPAPAGMFCLRKHNNSA